MADTVTSAAAVINPTLLALDPSLITEGTLEGNGVFDLWMRAIRLHLLREYKEQRITGDEYAKAYIAILNNLLNAAVGFIVQDAQLDIAKQKLQYELQLLDAQVKLADKDLALKEKQLALAETQLKAAEAQYKDTVDDQPVGGVLGKQMKVYDAQAKGFHDNALQSAAKLLVDNWSIRRQTDEGLQTTPESNLYDANIGNAVSEMLTNVGITIGPRP